MSRDPVIEKSLESLKKWKKEGQGGWRQRTAVRVRGEG